ncbi:hypothetical protein SAMN05443246_2295 [Paenibacillus sp. GP183]|nr:hypothetical protein SAMN05443246_2295 [Paenibacillus sp. GP183]
MMGKHELTSVELTLTNLCNMLQTRNCPLYISKRKAII